MVNAQERIDVHQHLVPPEYRRWLLSKGLDDAGGRDLPDWDVASTIDLMDRHDIKAAILSISTPGTMPAEGAEAAKMARTLSEFSASVVADFPARFGFFATLPLPDVTASLDEACHALDVLHADGVTLLANSRGMYLGAPALDALMERLDARNAVAFVHPGALPGDQVDGIPPFAADFLLDTTRAALNLVRNDVPRRFPNIRFILSHAGGFVPYAAHRMALAIAGQTARRLGEILEDFRSFYFDLALSGSPAALPSVMAFSGPDHVLFGSDWPFAPAAAVSYFTAQLDKWGGLSDQQRAAIDRGNAARLLPRFASM
jgi:predicted TIM-barrel fold metal-dependent hydrolase